MAKYKLGDIAPIQQGSVPESESYWLLNLDMVESNTGHIYERLYVPFDKIGTSTIAFDTNNVLYSKLRPYLNKVVIPDCPGYATSEMLPLKPNKNYITREYLTYFLRSPKFVAYINEKTSGAKMPRANSSDLKSVEIECPTLENQRHITSEFDRIISIVRLRQQQLQKLDELVKARFVEMFGDMLLNDMAWQESILDTLADVVSGITKGRKIRETELIEVPYMAVSNVKDGYIDWTTVKTIMATKQEIEQYRLLPYDVLMTEGGDPDKLGRGSVITKPLKNSIHQNHIFRVRLQTERILPVYFSEYLQHQKAKRYFLGCAKQTTGIASINMKQLRALPVLVPPLKLQEQFAAFVEQTDKSKVIEAIYKTNTLFNITLSGGSRYDIRANEF